MIARAAITVDAAYRKASEDGGNNPNREIIGQLKHTGAKIYVCLQALHHHGYDPDNTLEDVTVAASAATVDINKQTAGYAYLPFH